MSVLQEVKPMDPAGFFLGCKNSGSHCGIATFDLPNKHPMSHWLRNSEMSGVIDVFFCFSNLSYFSGSRNHIQDTYFFHCCWCCIITNGASISASSVTSKLHTIAEKCSGHGNFAAKNRVLHVWFFLVVEALAKLKYWDRRVSTQLCKFWHRIFSIFHNWSKDLLESHHVRALAALEMAKAKAGDRQDCPHSVRMALVAASAATAEAATFPIDFGKTRMQLHSGRWGLGWCHEQFWHLGGNVLEWNRLGFCLAINCLGLRTGKARGACKPCAAATFFCLKLFG